MNNNIEVKVSARHIHLSKEDYAILFGDNSPNKIKDIGQKNWSIEQTVEIVGPKNTISNVRVVMPFRIKTQLEISRTDAIFLGVNPPLQISSVEEAENIEIKGPFGKINGPFAIISLRHIHLNHNEAKELNLLNNDYTSVYIAGERKLVFNNVLVRVSNDFEKEMHIDTDEANAAGISSSTIGEIIKV